MSLQQDGAIVQHTARLVVGADGRDSRVRRWAGFGVRRDPPGLMVSGMLFKGMAAPRNTAHLFITPSFGDIALHLPQSGDYVRSCFSTARRGQHGPLSGANHIGDFIRACCECGTPEHWFAGATAFGPLANFEGSANWMEHPYREGIALIGGGARDFRSDVRTGAVTHHSGGACLNRAAPRKQRLGFSRSPLRHRTRPVLQHCAYRGSVDDRGSCSPAVWRATRSVPEPCRRCSAGMVPT